MKVAILHYHLNAGGVTRVIGSQIKALFAGDRKHEVMVICGNASNQTSLSGARVWEFPGLQYMKSDQPGINFEHESSQIMRFIKQQAEGFILHFHNSSLGKNPAVTLAACRLAEEGYRIVNHCHDFPEDRPDNMLALNRMARDTGMIINDILYPDRTNYHFAVLNSCDYNRVLKSAVPGDRVHLLPNPVSMPYFDHRKADPGLRSLIVRQLKLDGKKKVCTYPVRAIRRKNLGEFLLLAVLFERTCQFVVTQAPLNPDELPGYLHWKDFCLKHGIGIKFEAGEIVNHEKLIGISDFCITTSAREGFGMVYLEPWLTGTPVTGRDLPCITADLRRQGIEFPRLYEQIMVQTDAGRCDFKDLDPGMQEELIGRIMESSGAKDKLIRMNPFLENLFADIAPDIVDRNRQIILNHFSVANYGKRLLALYKSISG